MISERNNIAASYTAEGEAEAQKIHNQTDKQVAILKAQAQKNAAMLEAEGEAAYMETLSKAYDTEEKAEFYNYIRGLDALKASLVGDKTIILDKNSELAKILVGNFD
jgi:membrane protease subunit HflC